MALTEIQCSVLAVLAEQTGGGPPNVRGIARRVGISSSSVDVHILRLERAGLVKARRPTGLYRLLADIDLLLAVRVGSESDKPAILAMRERIWAEIGNAPR